MRPLFGDDAAVGQNRKGLCSLARQRTQGLGDRQRSLAVADHADDARAARYVGLCAGSGSEQTQGECVMKRLHVHVAVEDLSHAIGFYSTLFAQQPAMIKADYAKWMLDDPRVNFAISTRGRQPGLDHLGIQVESKDELSDVYARLRRAGGTNIEQGQTTCCYATSEKS